MLGSAVRLAARAPAPRTLWALSFTRSDCPMRICIVARVAPVHGIGGMQDHTRDLARGLAAVGHEVEVVTARHPDGRSRGGRGRRQVALPRRRRDELRRPRVAPFLVRGVRTRRTRERPFDVVHGEGSSALELVRRGVHRRTPVVVMFHGNFFGLARASFGRQLAARRPIPILREQRGLAHLTRQHFALGNWRVFRACEAIVPSRQQVGPRASRTCSSARGCMSSRTASTRPRSGRARARRREPSSASSGGFLFACVGRLNREKGVHHAIDALATPRVRRLRTRGSSWSATARSGRGWSSSPRRSEFGDRVIFTGARPPDSIPAYLAASDVFVFPTERDEAAPLILPQAMACGLPVIASARGGIPEVIDRPGENGLLVRGGEP